jgi:hypothetical protein
MGSGKDHKEHEPSVEELVMKADARRAADPIAAFHKRLITEGMSEETARQVTALYARRIMFGQYIF